MSKGLEVKWQSGTEEGNIQSGGWAGEEWLGPMHWARE